MAIPKKILKILEINSVKYEVIEHRKVYTAYDKSKTLKRKESLFVKTLLINSGKIIFIVLIPSDHVIDIDKIIKSINKEFKKENKKEIKKISFVPEKKIKELVKGIKEGSMPPFAQIKEAIYIIDKKISENSKVIVNSGSNTESIILSPTVLKKLLKKLKQTMNRI